MFSLKQSLIQEVNNTIEICLSNFIKKIAETYNLDITDLEKILNNSENKQVIQPKSNSLASIDTTDMSAARLLKCTKLELAGLCKTKGFKCTGTKEILINRLLGNQENKEKTQSNSTIESKPKNSTKQTRRIERNDIVKKLSSSVPVIVIRKNCFGNREHPETSLVFDEKENSVIGVQNEDGTISELSEEDIENCKKFKFDYRIPTNLDGNNLNDAKIGELEENDIIDDIVKNKTEQNKNNLEEEDEIIDDDDDILEEEDEQEIEDDD